MNTYEAQITDQNDKTREVRGAWMPLEKASLYAPESGGEFVDVEIYDGASWEFAKGAELDDAIHALKAEMRKEWED